MQLRKYLFELVLCFTALSRLIVASELSYTDLCLTNLSQGFSCFQSLPESRNLGRNLEFLHITKTGGTTLENLAYENEITWGFHRRDELESILKKHLRRGQKYFKVRNCVNAQWHWPSYFFPEEVYNKPSQGKATDLFTVVRHPYTRAISEYRWEVGFFKNLPRKTESRDRDIFLEIIPDFDEASKKKVMNEYLRRRLGSVSEKQVLCSHYKPQVDYLLAEHGERKKLLVENVLRFENLQDDFRKLSEIYDLGFDLDEDRRDQLAEVDFNFSIDDLSRETKKILYDYYRKDFDLLGYRP